MFEGVKLYEDSCRSVLRDLLNQDFDSTSDQGLGAIGSMVMGLRIVLRISCEFCKVPIRLFQHPPPRTL